MHPMPLCRPAVATPLLLILASGLTQAAPEALVRIHDVQGPGASSPIVGSTVEIQGVVTASFQGSNKLRGFFVQERDANIDADPNTSEAVFVFCNTCTTAVAEGQLVSVSGSVTEFNGTTEIVSTAVSVLNPGNHLGEISPSPIDLPISGVIDDFYEAREGMLVAYIDTLSVGEHFQLFRFGELELYEGSRPRQFTELNAPSVSGYAAHLDALARRTVLIDDDNNTENAPLSTSNGFQAIYYPQVNGGLSVGVQGIDYFRAGDRVANLAGILSWDFAGVSGTDAWRLRPTLARPVIFTVANPRPADPPTVDGSIKVVSMNLLNYFTTIDTTSSNTTGSCGPAANVDCRGADSLAELIRQRGRTAQVICSLNADIYGLVELENTAPSASITDLLGAINTRCGGANPYTFANTGGTLGNDVIRVQQIFRTGIVAPVGSPQVDLDPIHSRPPTAVTYEVSNVSNLAFGQRFTVIVNHFKSKGSSAGLPGDADLNDGAGASNATRTAQANRLLTWINSTVLPNAGDPDVLLVGDFNAYAQETPITILTGAGYNDLVSTRLGANAYSYLFDGQVGHLDYVFASAALAPEVRGIGIWHINADELELFDYSDEIKDLGEAVFEEEPDGSALVPARVMFEPASPFRTSDHDPVIIGVFGPPDAMFRNSFE